jgi:D-amino-acid oxidase
MNISNNISSGSVLVIGAGVSGLTSALVLRRRGLDVTVVADRFAPQVTSVVAGALWEWPPAVCGHHTNLRSLARSKSWCETSYTIFGDLAADPATGVFIRPVTFYFREPIALNERQHAKMIELAGKVDAFRHDAALIAEKGVGGEIDLADAYTHMAPMVETDIYMGWLMEEVRRVGCRIVEEKITGLLRDREEELLERFGADAIVNCAGLGARELGDDSVYPLRGAIIRVRNDGRAMPKVTEAHCISHDGSSEDSGFLFIVPRGDDMLVLGGFSEPGEWDLDLSLDNHEPIREVHRRCIEFMPALADAEIEAAEPVRSGLRPFRDQNVRLESEAGTRIVHNYGHGGSGITFSWGCAFEVAGEVERLLGIGEDQDGAVPVSIAREG